MNHAVRQGGGVNGFQQKQKEREKVNTNYEECSLRNTHTLNQKMISER